MYPDDILGIFMFGAIGLGVVFTLFFILSLYSSKKAKSLVPIFLFVMFSGWFYYSQLSNVSLLNY